MAVTFGADEYLPKLPMYKREKVKLSLSTTWRSIRGRDVQLHSFLTSALGQSGQHHDLATKTQERTWASSEQDAGWTPEPVWMFGEQINLLAMPGFEPLTTQPVT